MVGVIQQLEGDMDKHEQQQAELTWHVAQDLGAKMNRDCKQQVEQNLSMLSMVAEPGLPRALCGMLMLQSGMVAQFSALALCVATMRMRMRIAPEQYKDIPTREDMVAAMCMVIGSYLWAKNKPDEPGAAHQEYNKELLREFLGDDGVDVYHFMCPPRE